MPIPIPPNLDFNAANGKQLGLIRTAFLAVFVRRSKLVIFLSDYFNKNFDEFSEGEDFEDQVFNLLRDARGEGWLADLVSKATQIYERATALRNMVDQWFLFADTAPPARPAGRPDKLLPEAAAASPDADAVKGGVRGLRRRKEDTEKLSPSGARDKAGEEIVSQIEVVMQNLRDPQLAEKWLANLGAMRRRVCRISGADGMLVTGFLIGPNLAITTGYGAEALRNSIAKDGEVSALFDYEMVEGKLNQGSRIPVRSVTLGGTKQPSSVTDLLAAEAAASYGLLTLAEPEAEDKSAPRGWFDLTATRTDFTPGAPLFMLHYPLGRPMHMSEGVMIRAETRSQLRYRAETAPGSGGAPIFDENFRLVGLHEATLNTQRPSGSDLLRAGDKLALRADALAEALKASGRLPPPWKEAEIGGGRLEE